ncbi:MAG: abortive infection family protein [Rickettsiales bacterium]|jgi:hypothetical protein|nr:abortive infection family protein [Rickettsiales bacterium]
MQLPPSQIMKLAERIEKALWAKFDTSKYVNVHRYMKHWQKAEIETDWNGNEIGKYNNFEIVYQHSTTVIDLGETLNGIKDIDLLLKIAFDLGLEVPSVIYTIPEVKTILAADYTDASSVFDDAYKKLESEPDIAITMASAALERIIRDICKDIAPCKKGDTLHDLASHILKHFKYFPSDKLNSDIRNVGGGILKIAQGIENIRSNYTRDAHGSLEPKYMQDQPLYAKLMFNSITTIALFLLGLKAQYTPTKADPATDDIPF